MAALAVLPAAAWADEPNAVGLELFEQKIHPVLAGVCFRCHGDQQVAGELRVTSREALVAGGDSGPSIVPGKPEESLLIKALSRADDVSAMPPDKALRPDQVADFVAWIKAGAPWPQKLVEFTAANHWAYQPVHAVAPPAAREESWPKTGIDRFVLSRMEAAGQRPAAPADRRTLLRRVTYDLTGLPPTAAEVAAFEQDTSPHAYETVVERLLASPHYGEQWGRHWLDVVRYADTAGENSDHPLPHAWRYRNWVIGALNRDLPYDQFVREQIAGDLIGRQGAAEEYADRVVATGYLAIARRFGHDIEKDMHLTFEDTLDTLGKSVLGLSLGCCRCHDHKYDPLSTRDYYGLYGILESSKFAYPGCEPNQRPRDLVSLVSPTEADRLAKEAAEQLPQAEAEIKRIAAAQSEQSARLKLAMTTTGHLLSAGEIDDGASVDIAQGSQVPLEHVVVRRGEVVQLFITPRGNHGADSTQVEFEICEIGGAARRWSAVDLVADLLAGNPHPDTYGNPATWTFLDVHDGPVMLSESLAAIDGRSELRGWRQGDTPSLFVNTAQQAVKVWTSLAPRQFFMHPGPGGPVALAWSSPMDGAVSIRGRITDVHPGGVDGVGWQVMHYAEAELAAGLVVLGDLGQELVRAQRARDALAGRDQNMPVAYAVTEGTPHNARIQRRGEPKDLGDEVPRKFPDFLGGQRVASDQASGRLELAGWLTDPANPLTARVMANRVWQGHFGRGLVKTPNDFGARGAPSTHPELLDYLASEFVRNGWSIKALHRLILSSATYQQAATGVADDLYVGFPRRRLAVEEVRDTLLVASGELDRTPGESHPFPPEASWSFTQHGPFAAEYDTLRRSVYVMQKRNRRTRFYALFDGADPNASTPLRDVTTVPTQALYFLNDPLLHQRAEKFAVRVIGAGAENALRVEFAYQQLFARSATPDEQADAASFLADYAKSVSAPVAADTERQAWSALARVLFATNEFLHID
jgi:Protein of unknown function (DUF1549)/Protein of unknown function (DUF1553)/Planctomycete cytochrome C